MNRGSLRKPSSTGYTRSTAIVSERSTNAISSSDSACSLSPDPSYGTHFFQDLVESQIYSLAVHADGPSGTAGEFLNWDFLNKAADQLRSLLPDAPASDCLKLIDVAAERSGQRVQLLMDGEKALAFFEMPGGL